MTWDYVVPNSWGIRAIDSEEEERALCNPTFLPVTEIETRARQIIQASYDGNQYLSDLALRIQSALSNLDLFRETGFTLSTPESVISSLENMCAMF